MPFFKILLEYHSFPEMWKQVRAEALTITKIRSFKHEPFFFGGGEGGGAYSWYFTVIEIVHYAVQNSMTAPLLMNALKCNLPIYAKEIKPCSSQLHAWKMHDELSD